VWSWNELHLKELLMMIILFAKDKLSMCIPLVASFPGLHAQLLSLAVQKTGGRPGRIYHMMHAAADITYCT